MNVMTAAVRGYAALIATRMADSHHGNVEGSVALTSPEEFPSLSEAAAQPQQDLQAQFEFGLRAIAMGLLGGPCTKQHSGNDDTSQIEGRHSGRS